MATADRKAIVRRFNDEAFMGKKLDVLDEVLTADCAFHQCGFLQPVQGREAIKELLSRDGAMAERRQSIERLVEEGDLVAVHYSIQGVPRKDFYGGPGGKSVHIGAMAFVRFEGNR